MSIELRDYQEDLACKAVDILQRLKVVYIAAEVRTGKTLTALHAADLYGARKVLFLTKKRAIPSIRADYATLNPSFEIVIINNESIHKVTDDDFDLLISDEHHRCSAFPKPSKTTKIIRQRFHSLPMIFLSGTPAAESGSQWYHQFWVSDNSPFRQYTNFYKWAKIYTIPAVKYLGALQIADYSKSNDNLINSNISPYLLSFTQKEAGFKTEIKERVLYYQPSELITNLVNILLKDLVVEGREETILADTAAKLMSKVHQLTNGTIIFDSGKAMILDKTKAQFMADTFKGKKIAIFYYFREEYNLLKEIYGDNLTDNLDEFNETEKNIALQQVSGSEGISLKSAECLVYYNFGYSGRQYIQSRDRLSTIDRKDNSVYFILSKKDINEKIYKVISKKKKYSEKVFIKDFKVYGARPTDKDNSLFGG